MSEKSIREQLEKAFWENKPVSTTDNTGLIQGLPVDNESYDTYAKTYNVLPAAKDSDESAQKSKKDKGVIEP